MMAGRTGLALATLGISLLSGCGTNTEWRDYFRMVRASLGEQKITLDQAAAIPFASLGYRLNGGSQGLLVLATDTNGDRLWTSTSRIVLLTRDGRIIRTVGLPRDRGALTAQGKASLPPLAAALKAPYRSLRQMDLPDIGLYGQSFMCLTAQHDRQIVKILGTAIVTVRVDERCKSSKPLWSFTDSYWIDPESGFVWRSIQHLHPSGLRIETEIFRPPE